MAGKMIQKTVLTAMKYILLALFFLLRYSLFLAFGIFPEGKQGAV